MNHPLFYTPHLDQGILSDSEAFHISKVLRAKPGTPILVTNGKGSCVSASIDTISPKRVTFSIEKYLDVQKRPFRITLAVAPTRKPERNEWMLEKLVEIGVDQVLFIKTTHTHTESFNRVVNPERMEKVAIAAMKQSGQFSLPEIIIGQELHHILQDTTADGRFIAYVPDKTSAPHLYTSASGHQNTLALIGPEGDFTPEEVELAEKSGFQSVSLGQTRLRTETAAITACHAIHIAHLL